MDNKYYGDDDLIFNTSTRLPVCFLVDVSGSMRTIFDDTGVRKTGRTEFKDGKQYEIVEGGRYYMQLVVDGVNKFYDAIKSDDMASNSCEISILGFSDNVDVLEDFESVDKKRPFVEPREGNNTNLGKAVERALDLLEERKNDYKRNGIDYFQPWLVIFTDGDPTDDVKEAQMRCQNLIRDKKLVVFVFTISDEPNQNILQGFTNKKIFKIKDAKIAELFEWLGKSVSVVSNSRPDEKIKLDASGLDDFLEI